MDDMDDMDDKSNMQWRWRQIEHGKSREEYHKYVAQVSREDRQEEHPQTPDVDPNMSCRKFRGRVKEWRKRLHDWEDQTDKADKKPDLQDHHSSTPFKRITMEERIAICERKNPGVNFRY